jgi:CSLREA domain-containing protein
MLGSGFARRVGLAVVAVVLASLALPVVQAAAAAPGAYVVDATNDQGDANPGDGVCATSDEDCTLRAAIEEANADDPGSTITFDPSTDGNDFSVFSTLDINTGMTITGNGEDNTTVDGSGENRAIRVQSGDNGTVTISQLTVTEGVVEGDGACVAETSGSTLIMSNVTLNDCEAFGDGGGLSVDRAAFTGDHLTLSDNEAADGDGGGAVLVSGTQAISLTNSTVSGNLADSDGGGVVTFSDEEGSTGALTIDNTTFSKNDADQFGGGLAVENEGTSTLTFSHLTFTNNTATFGGAIDSFARAGEVQVPQLEGVDPIVVAPGLPHFTDIIATENVAQFAQNEVKPSARVRPSVAGGDGSGGAIFDEAAGAVYERMLLANNQADDEGGGIYVTSGGAVVVNSTITGNEAASGAGIGVGRLTAAAQILFSTIDKNTASDAGGGIEADEGDSVIIGASILSANTPDNCSADGTITSAGANIDDGTTCAFGAALDKSSTDPMIGDLADNGGFSQTQALLPGSPAIDVVPAADSNGIVTDQRSVARPQGAADDVGAFEVQVQTTTTASVSPSSEVTLPATGAHESTGPLTLTGGLLLLSGLLLVVAAAELRRRHTLRHLRTRH